MTTPTGTDSITASVIRSAMETVCFEMATYVSRTATTPILNQSNERNATILDQEGRLAALSVGIPQFMLSSHASRCGSPSISSVTSSSPGDVIVANDPYHGGGHLPDFNVFSPVFDDDGRLVLVASIQCHHGDTGGAMAGGYNIIAKDIWSEGHPVSAPEDHRRWVERRDVVLTMRANNRLRRIHRRPPIPGRCGPTRRSTAEGAHRRLWRRRGALGRRLVRSTTPTAASPRRSRGWPDGTYEADVYVDADPQGNQDIHVHVAVTVAGDRLIIDFDGSDTRPDIQAWSTFGNTRGNAIAQLASLVESSIPKNEGFFDCVELRVPEGCCLNPAEGKPVSSGHPPPRGGGRRRHRRRHEPDHPRPLRSADLQVRQPTADVGR